MPCYMRHVSLHKDGPLRAFACYSLRIHCTWPGLQAKRRTSQVPEQKCIPMRAFGHLQLQRPRPCVHWPCRGGS